ncbi:MAG: twin-arginine translocation signal domain-containing protein [Nitrospinae bacterium]|nr:twin-arginine translocation signal domain-containing protein [Nitrospinota bacterium]
MDRRSFLKLGGAIAAVGVTGSCGQVAQTIIPTSPRRTRG